jgi:hypothetical protein
MIEHEGKYRDAFNASQKFVACVLNVDQVFQHNRPDSGDTGGSVPVTKPMKYPTLLEDESVEGKRELRRFGVYLATRE